MLLCADRPVVPAGASNNVFNIRDGRFVVAAGTGRNGQPAVVVGRDVVG